LLRGFCLLHPRNPPLRRWPDSDLYCWSPLSPLPGNHSLFLSLSLSLSLPLLTVLPSAALSRSLNPFYGGTLPPLAPRRSRERERSGTRGRKRKRRVGGEEGEVGGGGGGGRGGAEIAPLSRQIPTAPAFTQLPFHPLPLSRSLSLSLLPRVTPRHPCSYVLLLPPRLSLRRGLTPVGADATTASEIRSAAIKLYPSTVTRLQRLSLSP